MTNTTIEIEGLAQLIKKLDKLGRLDSVKAGIRAAAVHISGIVSKYPSQKHVPISAVGGWKSDKQRKWFFANLRKGNITIPYRRTDALKHRWTTSIRDHGFTAIIGNNTPYARFVMGDKQTAMMQKIGWKTTDTVAKEEKKRVQEYVFDAVRRAIGA